MRSCRPRGRTRCVALLAEGVDRNLLDGPETLLRHMSPSSRRAWIEITSVNSAFFNRLVALLAEGVDRNICIYLRYTCGEVALLAEGVDRNCIASKSALLIWGRPPRGGRG